MLIGIDASRALRAQRTGTEAYALHLIRALAAAGGGHRLRLYLPAAPPPGLLPGPPTVEWRIIPFPRLWTHLRLSAEMLRVAPERLFVPAHVLPLVHPRNSLVTVHDLGYRHYPQAHPWRQRLYLDWSTRWSARMSRALLADSQATRDDLVRCYGADPAKITVVYPGHDETLRRVDDPAEHARVRAAYGIAGDYLLHVGTLHPRKNLARLIEAFARLRADAQLRAGFPGLQLVLAGARGWLAAPILARVRELGLEGAVVFPGYVAAGDLAALLSGARAYAFPSLYEGFGFPALEAQACGVPLVAARASSLPEVAGEGAHYVDPLSVDDLARGLRDVLTREDLRAALVARGTANLARFGWARAAAQVLEVLGAMGEG
jgi:glycosyltransferase involved in cell wall biosynthesis